MSKLQKGIYCRIITVLLFFKLLMFPLNAQRQEQSTLMARAGYDTCEIYAFQYNEGRIVNQGHRIDRYSSAGILIGHISYDTLGNITSQTNKEVSGNGLIITSYQRNKNGEIEGRIVYQEQADHKILYYYQINKEGDTLVRQHRFRDVNGNDSVLYTKLSGEKYYKSMSWNYDKRGRLIIERRFDVNGGIIYAEGYTYIDKGYRYYKLNSNDDTVLVSCMKTNTDTAFVTRTSTGYNYGIAFENVKGGRIVTKYNKEGLMEEKVYFDQNGIIVNRVKFEYR
ncbi:MAG: hypothetical protein ACK5Z2_19970 [Bacteroidota bacterium]|jgi:hypothetical protein